MKLRREVCSARTKSMFRVIQQACAMQNQSEAHLPLAEFSAQYDHVHALVEPVDTKALSRGMQGLMVRIARGVNRVLGRTGPVFADRFHARALSTPTEAKNALWYLLNNRNIHLERRGLEPLPGPDPFSSAVIASIWVPPPHTAPRWYPRELLCIAYPRTWLLFKAAG